MWLLLPGILQFGRLKLDKPVLWGWNGDRNRCLPEWEPLYRWVWSPWEWKPVLSGTRGFQLETLAGLLGENRSQFSFLQVQKVEYLNALQRSNTEMSIHSEQLPNIQWAEEVFRMVVWVEMRLFYWQCQPRVSTLAPSWPIEKFLIMDMCCRNKMKWESCVFFTFGI